MSIPVSDLSEEDFDSMMAVNAKSVLYGMQTAIPYFKTRRKGHVINVSSLLGKVPMSSHRAMYSASKAAMNSLTCNMRVDLQNEGYEKIHVSLFIPGLVATDFGLHAIGGGPNSRDLPGAQPVEEVIDMLVDLILHPRAELYTRPSYKKIVAEYFNADDLGVIEQKPPFANT